MHKALLGILLAAGATSAQAAVEFDFSSPSGNLGTSETYTSGSLSFTAYGYSNDVGAGGVLIDLYGKNGGGNEDGLGLASDPSGDNEIYTGANFARPQIVLDVSSLLGLTTGAQFFMNSTTDGENWVVVGILDNNAQFQVVTGADEGVHDLPDWGTFNRYGFISLGTFPGRTFGNVLLGGLSVTPSVPEPNTWAMMLLGFGAVGFAMRRRRQTELTFRRAA